MPISGTLYLVATPIGNLRDITLRALDTLRSADIIACEDTRHTRKLLNHFDISAKLVSYHLHNERERSAELCREISEGKTVAVVSDAGTPGISDPGFAVVRKAIEQGLKIVSIPGPTAFVSAAALSGLSTETILFAGFLPSRKTERRKTLSEMKQVSATLIFYEAPHRLAKSLIDCVEILGDRPAAVVREITKIHEEAVRLPLSALADRYGQENVRGEIVLVIGGPEPENQTAGTLTLSERVREIEAGAGDRKSALKQAAREFGLSKSEAYRQLLAEKIQ